jgi:plasmid stabilization system protein ParE
MPFRVEVTAKAKRDLRTIRDWLLAREAGEAGRRWFVKLNEAMASLAEFPNRCPIAPENEDFPLEVRQLIYGRKLREFRVLFTIDGSTVIILHVRRGSRTRLSRTH